MKKLFLCLLLPTGIGLSQVALQQQDFLNVFGPASTFHYSTERVSGTFDIGNTGGPNLYDFSTVSLANPHVSNNYDVGTIPMLEGRYPAGGFTFGESPTTLEKNPVFLMSGGTLYNTGEATTLSANPRFVHLVPLFSMMTFPTAYGGFSQQAIDHYDSTFDSLGTLTAEQHLQSIERSTIDGYGTLRIGGHDYQCIRVRTEHEYGSQSDVKEFYYFTREGMIVLVADIPLSAPNSGTYQALVKTFFAPSVVGVTKEPSSPGELVLHQNYPNPFNPNTTVTYELPAQSHVSLKVYNILGREVATLVDGIEQPGLKSVRFDASVLASGLYFCRLQAGGSVQTRKITLLK